MNERTQFERALIEHTRAFLRQYVSEDPQSASEVWFVMRLLESWEKDGARVATAMARSAWDRSSQARAEASLKPLESPRITALREHERAMDDERKTVSGVAGTH